MRLISDCFYFIKIDKDKIMLYVLEKVTASELAPLFLENYSYTSQNNDS